MHDRIHAQGVGVLVRVSRHYTDSHLDNNFEMLRAKGKGSMNKVGKVKGQSCWRLVGGVIAALLFVAVLIVHIIGKIEFDEVALALLVCVVGSIIFALSYQFGIAKFTAGPLGVEIEQLVERAVAELPREQMEETWRVLKKRSSLFPVIGVRLLWVDDRPESLIPQRRLLRRLGIEVVTVESTETAVAELSRDGDFVLIVQDRLRNGRVDDARALVEWLETHGPDHCVKRIPLVVFTWDPFDKSIGVKERNWITQDFASLLDRTADEVQQWKIHSPVAQDKPLTI